MLVKIKDQICEVTDINGNQLKENEIMLKKILKSLSYIFNNYGNELDIDGDMNYLKSLYEGALEHAGINIRLIEYDREDIFDLDN